MGGGEEEGGEKEGGNGEDFEVAHFEERWFLQERVGVYIGRNMGRLFKIPMNDVIYMGRQGRPSI